MSNDKYADCCNPGGTWEGSPSGEERNFAGITSYVTKAPTRGNGNAIVLVSDIHGYNFKNLQLLADQMAEQGYLVVAPDFFHGDKYPMERETADVQAWFGRNDLPNDRTKVDLGAVINELRAVHGAKKVACQGFCWGGWWAVWLAGRRSAPEVDAVVVAHGSKLTAELLAGVRKPALFLQPEHDQMMPPVLLEHVKQAAQNGPPGCDVVHIEGQHHGFTLRPDLDEPGVKEASDQALKRAIIFFREQMEQLPAGGSL